MNDATPKLKNTIFDIQPARFDETPEVVEFLRHKKELLKFLRDTHASGPKTRPFNESETWHGLSRAAYSHFQKSRTKHKKVLLSQRVDRLHELAKILSRASKLADKSIRDEIGYDLYQAWCAETNTQPATKLSSNGTATFVHPAEKLEEAVTCLRLLGAVVSRAAKTVPRKRGPISGSGILPAGDILALAATYERSTGLKPKMGPGRFAGFVEKFLTAVGQGDDIAQDYVVEALKYVLRRERKASAMPSSSAAKR